MKLVFLVYLKGDDRAVEEKVVTSGLPLAPPAT